jgi:uncharacterized protein YneF (UPF0154 family)
VPPIVPLEYVIAIVIGVVILLSLLAGLVAGGVYLSRRNADLSYGHPPRWLVKRWKRMHAERICRLQANQALADLVEENAETGDAS